MNTSQGNSNNLLNTLIGLLIVGIAGWGVWTVAKLFFAAFAVSQPPVQAAVIAGSATILVSVASLILSSKYQKKREIEAEHRKQKSEIYEKFIQFHFKMLLAEKFESGPMSEKEMLEFVMEFSQRMIVWGSDDVLKEYQRFRYTSNSIVSPAEIMLSFEKLLYTMRIDLGHHNKNLSQKDLLSLFLNDIDEMFPK